MRRSESGMLRLVLLLASPYRTVESIAYSPNGQHTTSGSTDGTIRIWDIKTGAAVGDPLEGHISHVRSVAYSPDGKHIISGSGDTTIQIWDIETGTAVGKPPKGHSNTVRSVVFSPDGQRIISGSDDGTIHVWESFLHAPIQLSSSGNPKQQTFWDGQTQMVGSETQRVAYYIGYPQTVVQACIHLLSLQSLQHLILDQFLLILRTLPLEPLGPRFSAVHSLSLSFPQTPCL